MCTYDAGVLPRLLHLLLPFEGGIHRVDSMLRRVRTCRGLVQGAVLLELLRDFGHQSVVGVWVCYQLLDAGEHRAQVDCRLPLPCTRPFRTAVSAQAASAQGTPRQ